MDVLIVGTGEYSTGFGADTKSDKKAGVVLLTCLDLRARGLVGEIHLAGTNGRKLPAIREHVARAIGEAYPRSFPSAETLRVRTYPADDTVDPEAYKAALAAMPRGSAVIIFTPDDTHFKITLDSIQAGHHVLATKPIVQTLDHHKILAVEAEKAGVLVAVEVHKRWDPIYEDARTKLRAMGDLNFMAAYMSQPKAQLAVFKEWAGRSSDISYYLNSHHVDFTEYAFGDRARPVSVVAAASTGIAEGVLGRPCEDSISLMVTWRNNASGSTGVATYTASWAAPRADVHSQQRFHCVAAGGEVTVDQAHRGYTMAADASGFASVNPLFMRYSSDEGRFVGQSAYGYRSIELFVVAAADVRAGKATARDFDKRLATVHCTMMGTAILEAGRRSLDAKGAPCDIVYATEEEDEARSGAFHMQPIGLTIRA